MELLQHLLPGSNLLRLDSYAIGPDDSPGESPGDHNLTFKLCSTQTIAECPLCGSLTQRVHSRYERTLADLPCMHFSLKLLVQVCKFFCPNSDCRRCIFTERLPEVAAPWARKTVRFVEHLQAIGLALGGAAGARLGTFLGYASSGSTLLNHLQLLTLSHFETPKILGVDDFAFRKGHNYGTILVNLETHQPIALLADRKADTLAEWLQAHPGIEVLSRDRSKTYKSAMDRATPEAMQVADRFHLVKNLSETLAIALGSYGAELKATEQAQDQSVISDSPEEIVLVKANPAPTSTPTTDEPQPAQIAQQRRIQQQKAIKDLSAQGWPQAAIAQKVGVNIRTVQRFLARPDFPEKSPNAALGQSILAPYKQQILAWWNANIRRPNVLMALLKPVGYEGSTRTLQRYISHLRSAQGLPPSRVRVTQPLPKVVDLQTPPLTPRRAAYLLVLKPENREPDDTALLEKLASQHSDIERLIDPADEFLQLLRQRKADAFDSWILKALTCKIQPLKRFAEGLLDDYDAVKASMSTDVSNGPVEGLNNKLKMLKRQMYGRAGLDLLAKRFIMTP